jgi:hypothetical protein
MMEPGKIRLINSGTQGPTTFTQTIALAMSNRLYRVTNDGPGDGALGTMRIRTTRTVLWWTVDSVFDLESGRSVDVYGSSLTVTALDTLKLFGSYDTI